MCSSPVGLGAKRVRTVMRALALYFQLPVSPCGGRGSNGLRRQDTGPVHWHGRSYPVEARPVRCRYAVPVSLGAAGPRAWWRTCEAGAAVALARLATGLARHAPNMARLDANMARVAPCMAGGRTRPPRAVAAGADGRRRGDLFRPAAGTAPLGRAGPATTCPDRRLPGTPSLSAPRPARNAGGLLARAGRGAVHHLAGAAARGPADQRGHHHRDRP